MKRINFGDRVKSYDQRKRKNICPRWIKSGKVCSRFFVNKTPQNVIRYEEKRWLISQGQTTVENTLMNQKYFIRMYWTNVCRPTVNVKPKIFEKHLTSWNFLFLYDPLSVARGKKIIRLQDLRKFWIPKIS